MFRQLVDKAVKFTNVTSLRLCTSVPSTPMTRIGVSDLNQVQVVGNVGSAPEMKPKGYVSFDIANHKRYQTKYGENVNKTIWLRVIASRPYLIKKVMDTVKKGDKLFVLGSISCYKYRNDETNKIVSVFFIVADQVFFFDSYTSLGARIEEDGLSSNSINEPEDEDFDTETEKEL